MGYLEGTRKLGFAAEGLFHPDQARMVEDHKSSSGGASAGAAGNRGSSHSASAGSVASDARRRGNGGSAAPSPSRVEGRQQLCLANTSSAESWSKYKIQDPRLQFLEGDHLVSERVSRTTGEHFGYVVDSKYPAKEKRPNPDKSKGYFHPEQVQIVYDSSPSSNHGSNVRSSPGEKHNDTPAAGGATGGGNCAPDKDTLLSRELSSKRRKTGRESANDGRQANCANDEAKLSQSLLAKRGVDNEQGRDAKASKRPSSDPGIGSGPLHEENTETKLSRGLSAKRVKRSDSAASSTSESNNAGINGTMLRGRFEPPQREQPLQNAAKRKVETVKPHQAREMVARKDSSRSVTSSNSANAKTSANDEIEITRAKENRAALSAQRVEAKGDLALEGGSQGRSRTNKSSTHECAESPTSAAAVSEENNSLGVHDLVALQSKPPESKKPSPSEYVQVPTAMAMKARFPPGCVVIHTSADGSTSAYTICSVHLKLSSDKLVSGRSNFDVLFKVGTGEDEKILPEESLVYARDCPILVKSVAVPHIKSESGWVPATVKSSMQLPGALEEDYVVTIANGGTAHVPRDTIRYRDPPLSGNTCVPMSIDPSSAPGCAPGPAPPVAVVVAPAPTSTTETASTESVTEDASKDSSCLERAPKKVANASAVTVCRIDVPDRVAFGTVQKLLSPKMGPMKKRLKVEMFIVGSDLPPPKDARIVRSFGEIFPRPLPSGVYSSTILISGQAQDTEKARKAIIFFLKEGVPDDESLDKDLEAGCSKARAITNSDTPSTKVLLPAKKSEPAIPTKGAPPVPIKEYTSAVPTKPSPQKAKEESESSIPASKPNPSFSSKQFVLPIWLKYVDMDTFFESSKKKETESKILCSIRLVNRIAPIRLELSNNDHANDFWSEWCTLTVALAECCLGESEMPIFFYECTRRNCGKTFLDEHPVLQCHTARKTDSVVYALAIPLRNEQQVSHVIGVGGINTRRILKLGCKFKVYKVSLAGKYAFIESSSSKDNVRTARKIVEDLIEEVSSGEKFETTATSNKRTEANAEFRMPAWISYDDVSDFFEGPQVKNFECQSGVSIEISDRRSPMNIALSSSLSKNLWNEWESLTSAISWTIDEDMRPRFLYDVVMYNYGGKKERKTSPVLRCQSPFDSEERLLMAVLPIPTRPQGSYAGYIVGTRGKQKSRIEKIGSTFDVYEFPSRQDLSYVLVTGAVRSNVKTARDVVQERIDECRDLRKIEMGNMEDEDEEPQVIYQPPSNDLEDEDEDDEPEVVFRPQCPQEGKRTIQILNVGVFIGNDWAQVKRWQSKFGNRGVKISVRVREGKADVSGPEHELDSVVWEINSWQRSQRPSTPPRRQPRRTSDVVFGGVVM